MCRGRVDNKAVLGVHAPGEVGAILWVALFTWHKGMGALKRNTQWGKFIWVPMIILCAIFALKFVGKTTLAPKEKSSRIEEDELYADI